MKPRVNLNFVLTPIKTKVIGLFKSQHHPILNFAVRFGLIYNFVTKSGPFYASLFALAATGFLQLVIPATWSSYITTFCLIASSLNVFYMYSHRNSNYPAHNNNSNDRQVAASNHSLMSDSMLDIATPLIDPVKKVLKIVFVSAQGKNHDGNASTTQNNGNDKI